MLSQVFLKNTGGDPYSLLEYDYFEFNEHNQISLYRPIFDSGNATHELLGFETASRTMPRKLPTYSKESIQTRFSEPHIQHLVQVEGNARIVYRDLAKNLLQVPIAEKMTQVVDSAQQRLNTKAQHILQMQESYMKKSIRMLAG